MKGHTSTKFKPSRSTKRISFKCPECGEEAIVKDIQTFKNYTFNILTCGHMVKKVKEVREEKPAKDKEELEQLILHDKKTLYPYQVVGYHFAIDSGYNCLIADEQGLGKTIQALALCYKNWNDLIPILIVAKKRLCLQWQKATLVSCNVFAQVIENEKFLIPGQSIYIVSWDSLFKFRQLLRKMNFKTVIADEIQMMKNKDAKRTEAMRYICQE